METWRYELYHHGILGQKWGKRNGPPYPIRPSTHSASEKKAGWRRSLQNHSISNEKTKAEHNRRNAKNISLSDKQKRYIKIGAAAAGIALAAIGGTYLYKTGGLGYLKTIGKNAVSNNFGNMDAVFENSDVVKHFGKAKTHTPIREACEIINTHARAAFQENCGPCSAGMLIRNNNHLNVVAKDVGPTTWDDWEKIFPNAKHQKTPAPEDLKELSDYLSKKFTDGDNGMIGLYDTAVRPKHYIAFSIENGKTVYYDGQYRVFSDTGQLIVKGLSFDAEGNVMFGNKRVTGNMARAFIKQYMSGYDIMFTDYMQCNGKGLTTDVKLLEQYFERGM